MQPIFPTLAATRRTSWAGFCGVLMSAFMALPVSGLAAPNQRCQLAVQQASAKTGVPAAVLQAIAKTETGTNRNGRFGPWPWTMNTQGRGAWFEDSAQLLDAALVNIASGVTSFDLGCFQINYRWHGQEFDSLDQMINPEANALYAAIFLKSLFAETGDWTEAAGAYHSRTASHANRYKAKFLKHYIAGQPESEQLAAQATPARAAPRRNAYPLLKAATASGRLGSLVPVAHQ